jgi:hypothetical protein
MNQEPQQNADGTWSYGGQTFQSKEAADLFCKSRTEAGVVRADAPKVDTTKIITFLVLLALVVWGYRSCSGSTSDPTLAALYQCQQLIKASARDPSTTDVPYTEDAHKGKGPEMYFAWSFSTKPVNSRNGFGLPVNVGASCIVDRASGRITSASLDGKQIR